MEFKINKTTRLNDDYCQKESEIRNNRKIRNYSTKLIENDTRRE